MKTLISSFIFCIAIPAIAAISIDHTPDYVIPTDDMSTMRGAIKTCNPARGLSFLQVENAACPSEPNKAVGWDRPEVEPVSPGIPFQDQGIERQ